MIFSLTDTVGKRNLSFVREICSMEVLLAAWWFYLDLDLCGFDTDTNNYSLYKDVHNHWYFSGFHAAWPHNLCYFEKYGEATAGKAAVVLLRSCSQN